MTNHTINKPHKELGFTAMETAMVVNSLNKLLAGCQVHQQKLRQFHWNVVGSDFFELHELFENHYNDMMTYIDDIAERVRVFGKKPLSTFSQYIEVSDIEENHVDLTSVDMVHHVLKDYNILMSLMVDVVTHAGENGDTGTTTLVNHMILDIEKKHWQLTAWVKQDSFDVTP